MASPLTRNSSGRMYQGPTASRPSRTRRSTRSRWCGRGFEVVLEHGALAVEHEVAEVGVVLQGVEHPVDDFDQVDAEAAEGQVPLAVPVGVGDEEGLARGGAKARLPGCGQAAGGEEFGRRS